MAATVLDSTYFLRGPAESETDYKQRMMDYANSQNALAANKVASSNSAVSQEFFKKSPTETDEQYKQRMLDYGNQKRADAGLPPVVPGPAPGLAPPSQPSELTAAEPAAVSAATGDGTLTFDDKFTPNVLHDYVNYTYNISIHAVKPETYKTLIAGRGEKKYTAETVLIMSAGKYGTSFVRHPRFNEDFFVEDVKIETVVGLGAANKNTNAVTIDFRILEPNSFSLIEKLHYTAQELGWATYIEMTYIMQIDFYGYSSDGVPTTTPIPNTTKYIPFRLVNLGIKVSPQGAEYAVSAVPFHHQAYSETLATIPVSLYITADTVKTYFEKLATNLNDYQSQLDKGKSVAISDEVAFDIDPKIGSESVTWQVIAAAAKTDATQQAKNTPVEKNNKTSESATIKVNYGLTTFHVNGGTTIVDEINRIVTNSRYILNQMAVRENGTVKRENPDAPLQWFKVTTVTEILGWDDKRETYAKKSTYVVRPWISYNNTLFLAPEGEHPSAVKQYNYMFTGKNKDVLDFNVDYNYMYYTAYTALPDKFNKTSDNNIGVPDVDQNSESFPKILISNPSSPTKKLFLQPKHPISTNMISTATNFTGRDVKTVMAGDLTECLLNKRGGDMITLDLTIVGDPEFIKQDDIYFGISGLDKEAADLNYSIPLDKNETYVNVNFLVPVDFDQETGLLRKDMTQSMFSGYFKLITITNTFAAGKFEQKLNLVRVFDSKDKEKEKATGASVTNKDSTTGEPKPDSSTSTSPDVSFPIPVTAEEANAVPGKAAITDTFSGAPNYTAGGYAGESPPGGGGYDPYAPENYNGPVAPNYSTAGGYQPGQIESTGGGA